MTLLRNYIRSLLLELRDYSFSTIPTTDVYVAQLYPNGFVGYSESGNATYEKSGVWADLRKISGLWAIDIDADPKLKKKADDFVAAGALELKNSVTQWSKGELTRKYPNLWPTREDVPDELPNYIQPKSSQYLSADDSIKVDHNKKAIDLSAAYLDWNSRRPGKNRDGKAYVIPSGDVAMEGKQRDLQKLVNHVLKNDPRVTSEYQIIGNEKYRGKTVADLLADPREADAALTGRGKIMMYHGTSDKSWKKIRRQGLRPGATGESYGDLVKGWSEDNVYLTFDPAVAENYATRQAITDKSFAMVLKVEVPDYTKLRPDEDTMGWVDLDRVYSLKINPKKLDRFGTGVDPNKPSTVSHTHLKTALSSINDKLYIQDEEFEAFKKNIFHILATDTTKKGLNAGTIAYHGIIPPKFIKPFMEYKRQSFRTPEKKGGPRQQEYDDIRKDVQKKAKRFDEKRLRQYVRQLLERS